MKTSGIVRALLNSTLLLLACGAANSATLFYGIDLGAGPGGPHPNSDLARSSFVAALPGAAAIETFESHAAGSFLNASIAIAFPGTGVTGTITDLPTPAASGLQTEVRDSVIAPHYFAISGTHFIRIEAAGNPSTPPDMSGFIDITFSTPQTAIGFYGTSFSDYFGSAPGTIPPIRIALDGGAGIDTLNVDPAIVTAGSVNFFGIIADAPFTTARVFNPLGTGNDGIAIDNIMIAAAIPEPSTWLLMTLGLFGIVAVARSKAGRSQEVAAA